MLICEKQASILRTKVQSLVVSELISVTTKTGQFLFPNHILLFNLFAILGYTQIPIYRSLPLFRSTPCRETEIPLRTIVPGATVT